MVLFTIVVTFKLVNIEKMIKVYFNSVFNVN